MLIGLSSILLTFFSFAIAEDCAAIRETLLQYAQTQCGSELLNVLPPLSSVVPPKPTASPKPTPEPVVVPASGDVVIGTYYPNWFVYKKHYMGLQKINVFNEPKSAEETEQKYVYFPSNMKNIAPKITHLYYAFLEVDANCFVADRDKAASWTGAAWIPVSPNGCKGSMNDMLALKDEFPHLNLMISLGGWTFSSHFSKCASTEEGMKKMYDSFSFYVSASDSNWGKKGSLWKGVDFDWEHPGTVADHTNFDPVNDWPNYAKLVQYFRKRANDEGRTDLHLSSAIGVGDTLDILIKQHEAAESFCMALDFVNMMTYDLHGKWDPITGHNAQFCQIDHTDEARPGQAKNWAVKDRMEALAAICGAKKLNLGIPNYAPAWTKIPAGPNGDGLYQKASDNQWVGWSTFSDADKALVPQGILSYWDQKTVVSDSSFKVFTKNCPEANGVVVPVKWMYSESKQAFACLEDPETAQKKAEWARVNGYKGIFFWDASQDKDGDILDGARSGWGGLSVSAANGSPKCHDSGAPDFNKQPDGSESPYKGCHTGGKSVVVGAGEGCSIVKSKAAGACNGKAPVFIGGTRSSGGACVEICTRDWDNGPVGPWPEDVASYVCDGEPLPTGGEPLPTGGEPLPTGESALTTGPACTPQCKNCVPVSNASGSPPCGDCSTNFVQWWPCVSTPQLCQCKD